MRKEPPLRMAYFLPKITMAKGTTRLIKNELKYVNEAIGENIKKETIGIKMAA